MQLRGCITTMLKVAEGVDDAVAFGVNANTWSKDSRAWDMFERVCEAHGTTPYRSHADVRDFPDRNTHLLAALMVYAFAIGVPKDPARQFIKPRSAFAYPLAIIRVFGRWGISLPSYKALKAAVAGLCRLYLQYHGPHSLAPRRAEPMKFSMVRDINRISLAGDVTIGRFRWVDSHHDVFMFRRLNLVLIVTAFRLGEIVAHTSGEIMYLTFESLSWRIAGVVHIHPTPELLRGLVTGRDAALLAPPRSKPDQWGEIHCPFSVVLTYEDTPENAAAALRDIELRTQCPRGERESTPLFHDANRQPYSHAFLHSVLRLVLGHLYGSRVAELFSWHSYRSGLATALHAAGVDDPMIQLICRWMCPESLHVYRRMGTKEHESNVKRASLCDVDSMQSVNIPIVAGDQHMSQLSSWVLSSDARSLERVFEDAVAAIVNPTRLTAGAQPRTTEGCAGPMDQAPEGTAEEGAGAASLTTAPAKKKRGRPLGSKNKPKGPPANATAVPIKKKRGRPLGSKNKPKALSADAQR